MTKISMLEVRQNTKNLVERLASGECFTLCYRNQDIAILRPIVQAAGADEPDPVYSLADAAEELADEPLTARQADELIYGA